MTIIARFTLLAMALVALGACQAAHLIKARNIGHVVDQQLSLVTVAQKSLNLGDLSKNHRGSVLIFWQSACPCVKRYQQRVNDLFARHGEDLAFYHISSNTNESFADAIKEYQRRRIPLPLLRDEGKRLALALNAKGTPTAALLNDQGQLIFMGWIDNEREPGEPGRRAYLENAINDYLGGSPVSLATSPMFGCAIH